MPSSVSLREQLTLLTRLFQERNVDSPELSAQVLLAHALGLDRSELLKRLILQPDALLDEETRHRAGNLAGRRARGEPVAYILGNKEFYGREFAVSPDVLIPRPETELLVDLALAAAPCLPEPALFADFGTGSGCLAVSLALELPRWRGLALDISARALRLAARNAAALGARKLCCIQGDFTRPPLAAASLALLVSNPPYVSEAEHALLSPEVRDFEPKSALVPQDSASPAHGLEHALAVMEQASRLLRPGGLLLMEIGCTQGAALMAALPPSLWSERIVHRDLAGLDRVIAARRGS